jgi:hypothetical protein
MTFKELLDGEYFIHPHTPSSVHIKRGRSSAYKIAEINEVTELYDLCPGRFAFAIDPEDKIRRVEFTLTLHKR